MTDSEGHKEPCRSLLDTTQRLAKTETNEERTRSWVEDLSRDLKKTNDSIAHLEVSVIKQLSEFNTKLIAKTTIVTGSSAGGIVALIEIIKYLISK
jgi:enterochelin esterase-like enzyme